jgi:hypothetical protein
MTLSKAAGEVYLTLINQDWLVGVNADKSTNSIVILINRTLEAAEVIHLSNQFQESKYKGFDLAFKPDPPKKS